MPPTDKICLPAAFLIFNIYTNTLSKYKQRYVVVTGAFLYIQHVLQSYRNLQKLELQYLQIFKFYMITMVEQTALNSSESKIWING